MTLLQARYDLHCHTIYSDGTSTPDELFTLALEKGLKGLSITDHDTVAAYKEALPRAKERGLMLLPGIECSAIHRGEPVHVLGYAFVLDSPVIASFSKMHSVRREERNRKILSKLRKLGIAITEEELRGVGSGTLGRPHIALLLMQKGVVDSIKEAFGKYLGEGKAAYDPGERITVEETIDTIKKAGGKAILAHPQLIGKGRIERDMLTMPFDGLEGYYARLFPDQEEKWIKSAEKLGWIVTGGSDYHGTVKPQNPLGSSWTCQETFDLLYTHYLSHQKQ